VTAPHDEPADGDPGDEAHGRPAERTFAGRAFADRPPAEEPADQAGTIVVATEGPGRHAREPRTAAYYVRALGRRVRAQYALSAVLAVVVIAFVRIGLQHWREGTTELGLALLLAAVLRAALPDRPAGLLAVRPRRVDIVTYTVFGLIVILVSLTITGGPLASR
jgi:hypothetical protein